MWLKSDTTNWFLDLPKTAPWHGFHVDVQAARQWLMARSEQRWLLFDADSYRFTVWFFALLAENRQPVMPQNNHSETLRLVSTVIDAELPRQLPQAVQLSALEPLSGRLTTTLTLFTSGSSGEPQAIRKSARQLFNEVQTLESTFGETLRDAEVITTISHQHIYGLLFTVIWPVCVGRCLVAQRVEYLEQWQQHHQHANAYWLVSSPAHLERFDDLTHMQHHPARLRAVFSSGGPLADQVPQRFIGAGLAAPFEIYGSTETGGIGWRQRSATTTAFRRFTDVEIGLNNEHCLQLRSPHLPDDTLFTTTDKVELLSADEFNVLGRADRIVKIAEKRVSLAELERFCEAHPWIDKAKSCQLYQPRTTLGLVLVLTAAGQQQLAQEGRLDMRRKIREHLQQRFDKVVLPRKFRYVDTLPCNASGKTTLAMLQQLFEASE
ncbi:AMP-binding protein [Pseudidiomarina homiensis]|uniref:AMP-binding protein n=1 Tax=Pseudidiomarina homiensis TaxID=364198 RepID=UPI00215A6E9C|nr:AMP-binding protein [Pseudidiomarina homiensis]